MLEMEAEVISPLLSCETQRLMFWDSLLSNVFKLVMVELPLGKRMRSNGADWGSLELDLSLLSTAGGVHDDKVDLRVAGSYWIVASGEAFGFLADSSSYERVIDLG